MPKITATSKWRCGCPLCVSKLSRVQWLRDRMHVRYFDAFNFYFAKPVNEILNLQRLPHVIALRDQQFLDDCNEYLKRTYRADEVPPRLKILVDFFATSYKPTRPNLLPLRQQYRVLASRALKLDKLFAKSLAKKHPETQIDAALRRNLDRRNRASEGEEEEEEDDDDEDEAIDDLSEDDNHQHSNKADEDDSSSTAKSKKHRRIAQRKKMKIPSKVLDSHISAMNSRMSNDDEDDEEDEEARQKRAEYENYRNFILQMSFSSSAHDIYNPQPSSTSSSSKSNASSSVFLPLQNQTPPRSFEINNVSLVLNLKQHSELFDGDFQQYLLNFDDLLTQTDQRVSILSRSQAAAATEINSNDINKSHLNRNEGDISMKYYEISAVKEFLEKKQQQSSSSSYSSPFIKKQQPLSSNSPGIPVEFHPLSYVINANGSNGNSSSKYLLNQLTPRDPQHVLHHLSTVPSMLNTAKRQCEESNSSCGFAVTQPSDEEAHARTRPSTTKSIYQVQQYILSQIKKAHNFENNNISRNHNEDKSQQIISNALSSSHQLLPRVSTSYDHQLSYPTLDKHEISGRLIHPQLEGGDETVDALDTLPQRQQLQQQQKRSSKKISNTQQRKTLNERNFTQINLASVFEQLRLANRLASLEGRHNITSPVVPVDPQQHRHQSTNRSNKMQNEPHSSMTPVEGGASPSLGFTPREITATRKTTNVNGGGSPNVTVFHDTTNRKMSGSGGIQRNQVAPVTTSVRKPTAVAKTLGKGGATAVAAAVNDGQIMGERRSLSPPPINLPSPPQNFPQVLHLLQKTVSPPPVPPINLNLKKHLMQNNLKKSSAVQSPGRAVTDRETHPPPLSRDSHRDPLSSARQRPVVTSVSPPGQKATTGAVRTSNNTAGNIVTARRHEKTLQTSSNERSEDSERVQQQQQQLRQQKNSGYSSQQPHRGLQPGGASTSSTAANTTGGGMYQHHSSTPQLMVGVHNDLQNQHSLLFKELFNQQQQQHQQPHLHHQQLQPHLNHLPHNHHQQQQPLDTQNYLLQQPSSLSQQLTKKILSNALSSTINKLCKNMSLKATTAATSSAAADTSYSQFQTLGKAQAEEMMGNSQEFTDEQSSPRVFLPISEYQKPVTPASKAKGVVASRADTAKNAGRISVVRPSTNAAVATINSSSISSKQKQLLSRQKASSGGGGGGTNSNSNNDTCYQQHSSSISSNFETNHHIGGHVSGGGGGFGGTGGQSKNYLYDSATSSSGLFGLANQSLRSANSSALQASHHSLSKHSAQAKSLSQYQVPVDRMHQTTQQQGQISETLTPRQIKPGQRQQGQAAAAAVIGRMAKTEQTTSSMIDSSSGQQLPSKSLQYVASIKHFLQSVKTQQQQQRKTSPPPFQQQNIVNNSNHLMDHKRGSASIAPTVIASTSEFLKHHLSSPQQQAAASASSTLRKVPAIAASSLNTDRTVGIHSSRRSSKRPVSPGRSMQIADEFQLQSGFFTQRQHPSSSNNTNAFHGTTSKDPRKNSNEHQPPPHSTLVKNFNIGRGSYQGQYSDLKSLGTRNAHASPIKTVAVTQQSQSIGGGAATSQKKSQITTVHNYF